MRTGFSFVGSSRTCAHALLVGSRIGINIGTGTGCSVHVHSGDCYSVRGEGWWVHHRDFYQVGKVGINIGSIGCRIDINIGRLMAASSCSTLISRPCSREILGSIIVMIGCNDYKEKKDKVSLHTHKLKPKTNLKDGNKNKP